MLSPRDDFRLANLALVTSRIVADGELMSSPASGKQTNERTSASRAQVLFRLLVVAFCQPFVQFHRTFRVPSNFPRLFHRSLRIAHNTLESLNAQVDERRRAGVGVRANASYFDQHYLSRDSSSCPDHQFQVSAVPSPVRVAAS